MVDVGTVNSDSDSVELQLREYSSLIDGLGGNWKGASHDNLDAKANAFASEYSSKVSSQMSSFANAVSCYKQYESVKNELDENQIAYNKAKADNNKTDMKTYSEALEDCNRRLDELRVKINQYLSEITGESTTPTVVSSSGTSSSSNKSSNSNTGWSSYEDAITAGVKNLMTRDEFSRRQTEYSTYQDYLDAMYEKYITNGYINYDYFPITKTGSFDTKLNMNDAKTYDDTLKYSGEYIEYVNKDGILVRAPLAIVKYENGNIVYTPMTEEQKEQYINRITNYYNDVMDNAEDYSDRFKDETGDRVDSVTFVYVAPTSKSQIDSVDGYAGYCRRTGTYSNHSDILLCSDEFINFDDPNSNYNSQQNYDYMLNTYTHELGHAYGNNNMFFPDRDNSGFWNTVYDKVSSDSVNENILREYSLTNKYELFADATDYYYSDPDRLKQVQLDLSVPGTALHFDTLYDYMDFVMS